MDVILHGVGPDRQIEGEFGKAFDISASIPAGQTAFYAHALGTTDCTDRLGTDGSGLCHSTRKNEVGVIRLLAAPLLFRRRTDHTFRTATSHDGACGTGFGSAEHSGKEDEQ